MFDLEIKPPEGWWKIDARTDGREIVVLGTPLSEEQLNKIGITCEHPSAHNCDAMGCSSIRHVIARVWIWDDLPPEMWRMFNLEEAPHELSTGDEVS